MRGAKAGERRGEAALSLRASSGPLQLFRRPRPENRARGTEAGPTALGVVLIAVLCSAYWSRSERPPPGSIIRYREQLAMPPVSLNLNEPG
jgi:hypothetical protein